MERDYNVRKFFVPFIIIFALSILSACEIRITILEPQTSSTTETPAPASTPTSTSSAGIIFQENFNTQPDWNANNQFSGVECSVGSCAASSYPVNWNFYRSVAGHYGNPHPIAQIHSLPDSLPDHSGSAGKAFIVYNVNTSGGVFPGDGIIGKYFGASANHKNLYIQFWFRTQEGFRMEPATMMKVFRLGHWRAGANIFQWVAESGPMHYFDFVRVNTPYGGQLGYTSNYRCAPSYYCEGQSIPNDNGVMKGLGGSDWRDGDWHKVEIHVKMNTFGAADGVFEWSYDGTRVSSYSNIAWNKSDPALGWNFVALGGNSNNQFTSTTGADQWYAIDDVIVSTQPITVTTPVPTATPTSNLTPTSTPVTDTAVPTVFITSPTSGATVSNSVTITTAATDNVGVTRVEFYVDNALQGSVAIAPFTYNINTANAPSGAYILSAKAYDAAGNIGVSSSVLVNVLHTTATPTPTPTPTPTSTSSAGIIFQDNFDATPTWNASGEYDGNECSPLNVGAWSGGLCPASTYPQNWSGYRSMPGTPGLNPVVSINRLPDNSDHTTGFGKGAVIRQESVSGVVWPGDGILLKYLGAEYKELYIQFWIKAQLGFRFAQSGTGYFKMFRVSRKGNFASNWFDEHTQGVRPVPQFITQPKWDSAYGWRHIDPLRGYPDDGGSVWQGVCTDTTIFNGRKVCNYSSDRIEDPYEYGAPMTSPTAPGQMFDGAWHRVVYHLKMNDPGVANGILQMSIDGVLKTNASKLTWIGASGAPVGFNQFWLGGNGDNSFSSTSADQWYAFDDVVVSTAPIAADYIPH